MNCREFTKLVSAWLDGELDGPRRAGAEEHAVTCPDCSRLAEELRALDASLATEPAAGRSDEDWERFDRNLMVRIAMDERARLRKEARSRRLWGGALKASAAAAALLVAALGGYLLRGVRTERVDAPRVALLPGAAGLARDREYELERLLAAAERILVRLSNADPADREEIASVRSVVIDTGLAQRLAEARREASRENPALAGAISVEMVLIRVVNGSPAEASEFRDIRNVILDSALVERTRALRSSM